VTSKNVYSQGGRQVTEQPQQTGTGKGRRKPLLTVLGRFLLLDMLLDRQARPVFYYTATLVVLGSLLYHWLEGWSLLDSAYFMIITMTTIGYGDLSPTTWLSKLLTIFVALNGVAILLMLLDHIRRIRQEHIDRAAAAAQEKRAARG
jgi:voltage-gated potassium channel